MSVRETLTDLVAMLRAEKRRIKVTATSVPFMRELADALAPVLQTPRGSLANELESMWELIVCSPKPARAIFVPKPNSSNVRWAAISWLQILVIIAQAFSSAPRRIPPVDRRMKLGRREEVIKSARRAWHDYVRVRGARAAADELVQALEALLGMLPWGVELDDGHVVIEGARIEKKLTRSETVFLALLIDGRGQVVSKKAFLDRGIRNPVLLKHRLVEKSEFKSLDDYIIPDSGGYRLRAT